MACKACSHAALGFRLTYCMWMCADMEDLDFTGFLKLMRVNSMDSLDSLDQYDSRLNSSNNLQGLDSMASSHGGQDMHQHLASVPEWKSPCPPDDCKHQLDREVASQWFRTVYYRETWSLSLDVESMMPDSRQMKAMQHTLSWAKYVRLVIDCSAHYACCTCAAWCYVTWLFDIHTYVENVLLPMAQHMHAVYSGILLDLT